VNLYNNEDFRQRLGINGREKSLGQSWEKQVAHIYSLLS